MDNPKKLTDDLERALLTMNQAEAERIIMMAAKSGTPLTIASELVASTLQRIGDLWEDGTLALSQVYMSSIICEEIIDNILPPTDPQRVDQPRMAIAVFEDHHMLGKRIIYSALRASGYDLMDLGGGLTADQLIEIIRKEKIRILLLSVLMLPSALRIRELINRLSGMDVKVIVGGAPFRFDNELWKEIGAYACGKDTSEALEIITKLMEVQL